MVEGIPSRAKKPDAPKPPMPEMKGRRGGGKPAEKPSLPEQGLPSVMVDEEALGLERDAIPEQSVQEWLDSALDPAGLDIPADRPEDSYPPLEPWSPVLEALPPAPQEKPKGFLRRLFSRKERKAPEPELPKAVVEEPSVDIDMSGIEETVSAGYEGREQALIQTQAREAMQDMAKSSPEQKHRIMNGMLNMGVVLTEYQSRLFAGAADKLMTDKKFQDEGIRNKLLSSIRTVYRGRAADARKLAEDRTKMMSIAGGAKGLSKAGSLLSWGRVVLDFAHMPGFDAALKYGNPFRHVTLAASAFGTGTEIAKEFRLQTDAVRAKTWGKDAEAAADEAWALHDKAGGDTADAKSLMKEYKKTVPADLLARLEKSTAGTSLLKMDVLATMMKRSVNGVADELSRIEKSTLSPEEKEVRTEAVMTKHARFLKDADRMVGQAGTVDVVTYGLCLAKGAATVVGAALAAETAVRLVKWGGGALGDLLGSFRHAGSGSHHEALAAVAAGTGARVEVAPSSSNVGALAGEVAVHPEGIDALHTETPNGVVSFEMVGKGSQIVKSLAKQLEADPEKFGYHGPKSGLHAWAVALGRGMSEQMTGIKGMNPKLSTESIGHVSIGIDMSHGKPEGVFFDKTGTEISAADMKHGGFFMGDAKGGGGHAVEHVAKPPAYHPEVKMHESSILMQIHARERGVVQALLGSASEKLSPEDQEKFGRELMQVQRSFEHLRENPTGPLHDKYIAMHGHDVEKLDKDFGKQLPSGWSRRLDEIASRHPAPAVPDHATPAIPDHATPPVAAPEPHPTPAVAKAPEVPAQVVQAEIASAHDVTKPVFDKLDPAMQGQIARMIAEVKSLKAMIEIEQVKLAKLSPITRGLRSGHVLALQGSLEAKLATLRGDTYSKIVDVDKLAKNS